MNGSILVMGSRLMRQAFLPSCAAQRIATLMRWPGCWASMSKDALDMTDDMTDIEDYEFRCPTITGWFARPPHCPCGAQLLPAGDALLSILDSHFQAVV